MVYNVIDDGNNQLIKAARSLLFDWKFAHGQSRKAAPVSKANIELARVALADVDFEQDADRLAACLWDVVNFADQHNCIVNIDVMKYLELAYKDAKMEELS